MGDPPEEKVDQGGQDEGIGDINDRKEVLKDSIEGLSQEDRGRDGFRKESEMSEQDDEERPVKEKASQPEVESSLIEKLVRVLQFDALVPEEGTEKKDFKSQS